jgi:hypothetical protein
MLYFSCNFLSTTALLQADHIAGSRNNTKELTDQTRPAALLSSCIPVETNHAI